MKNALEFGLWCEESVSKYEFLHGVFGVIFRTLDVSKDSKFSGTLEGLNFNLVIL